MNIIRLDPLTGRAVLFAPRRGSRPHDFAKEKKTTVKTERKNCVFCVGNEKLTPEELFVLKNKKTQKWDIRVIPNKYAALKPQEFLPKSEHYLFKQKSAQGHHEVLIFRNHQQSWADLNDDMTAQVVKALQLRTNVLATVDSNLKYVHLIYNHGPGAGASVSHPHAQVFGLEFVPKFLQIQKQRFENFRRKNKKHLLEEVIIHEQKNKSRIIKESRNFLAWCPYSARVPFEVRIAPKKQKTKFEQLTAKECQEFAILLRDILKKIKSKLADPDLNLYFQLAPLTKTNGEFFHWHVDILPRLNIWAGLELGTEVVINSVFPETAAEFLR